MIKNISKIIKIAVIYTFKILLSIVAAYIAIWLVLGGVNGIHIVFRIVISILILFGIVSLFLYKRNNYFRLGSHILWLLGYGILYIAGVTVFITLWIVLHIIFASLYVFQSNKKIYLHSMILLFILNLVMAIIPFPTCDTYGKEWLRTSCDCRGFKKPHPLFTSQCVGIKTACYQHPDHNSLKNKIDCNFIRRY